MNTISIAAHEAIPAGSTGARTSIPSRFSTWLGAWRLASQQRAELHRMSDRELADVGIARMDIDSICASPSFFIR